MSDPPGSQPGAVSRCARGVAHAPPFSRCDSDRRHNPQRHERRVIGRNLLTFIEFGEQRGPGLYSDSRRMMEIAFELAANGPPAPVFLAAFANGDWGRGDRTANSAWGADRSSRGGGPPWGPGVRHRTATGIGVGRPLAGGSAPHRTLVPSAAESCPHRPVSG